PRARQPGRAHLPARAGVRFPFLPFVGTRHLSPSASRGRQLDPGWKCVSGSPELVQEPQSACGLAKLGKALTIWAPIQRQIKAFAKENRGKLLESPPRKNGRPCLQPNRTSVAISIFPCWWLPPWSRFSRPVACS